MNGEDLKDYPIPPRGPAEWFLAIHATEEPSPETLQAWLRWHETSEENRQAFEEIVQIWQKTPAAVSARPTSSAQEDEYDGSVPVAEWRAKKQQAVRAYGKSWRRPLIALAASAVVVTVGTTAYQIFIPSRISQGHFATRIGEQRELRLSDGSQVTLGANSTLTVDLQGGQRNVRLGSGEAYFSVAKDPARPFVVRALSGAITAIGTAFDVRSVADRVTVTVTEGRVAVLQQAQSIDPHPNPFPSEGEAKSAGASAVNLKAGEQVSYSPRQHLAAIATNDLRRVDANAAARWREGWLVYRDETLKYVIADIARYTDLKFKLADSAADIKFSGAVFKDNINEWIVALPEVAAVTVNRASDGFKISSRATAAAR